MTKCIVLHCENHSQEGNFIGDLCAPCYEYITTGNGKHSQAYRNTLSFALVVKQECADLCESECATLDGISCAEAIREMVI